MGRPAWFERCVMSAENSGVMSWDDVDDEVAADDFLANAEAQEVPKACSIDNPQCEACQ